MQSWLEQIPMLDFVVDSRDITFWTDAAMAVCAIQEEDGIEGIGKENSLAAGAPFNGE